MDWKNESERKKWYKKKAKKPKMIFTLDTETRGLHGKLFKVGLYGDNQYFEENNFAAIKKRIYTYSLTHDVHIYIHNLDFDIAKIVHDLKEEFIFEDMLFINRRPATIPNYYFTFHDSLQLLANTTLKQLCKDFSLEEEGKMELEDHFLNDPAYKKYAVYSPKEKTIIPLNKWEKYNIKISDEKVFDPEASLEKFFKTVDPEDPLLRSYLKLDCTSLYKIIMKVQKESGLKLDDFLSCPTAASIAMRVFKKQFPDQFETASSSFFYQSAEAEEAEDFLRSAYYGGRTEVFKSRLKNGFSFDVTSLYPYVMREFKYPVGNYKTYKGRKAEAFWKLYLLEGQGGGAVEATVEVPKDLHIPLLPFWCDKREKLIFPAGQITGSWVYPELKKALQLGYKIKKIHKLIHFDRMSSIFIGYVNFFEKMKNDNTEHIKGSGLNKEGKPVNKSLRALAKIFLNSLYGKFGSRRERSSLVALSEIPHLLRKWEKHKNKRNEPEKEYFKLVLEHGIEEADNLYFQDEDYTKRRPKLFRYFADQEEVIFEYATFVDSAFIQPQISAYVTAYARIHLYEGFEEIWKQGGQVYYCDTDSIYSDVRLPEELIDSATFGKWKLEKENVTGKFADPKDYLIIDEEGKVEVHSKGNKKQTTKYMQPSDYDYKLDEKENNDGGFIEIVKEEDQQTRRSSFYTILKSGEDDFDRETTIIKNIYLKGEYNKRRMDYKNNTSYPWVYDGDNEPEIDKDFEEENERRLKEDWELEPDPLIELINSGNKMLTPSRSEEIYKLYIQLPVNLRRFYFSKNGSKTVAEIAASYRDGEFLEEDILMDLDFHYYKNYEEADEKNVAI